jgi:hypothetical protein
MGERRERAVAAVSILRSLWGVLFVLGLATTPACLDAGSAAVDDDNTGSSESAVGRRPVDLVERFPDVGHVHRAMDLYMRDPLSARMGPPIGVAEFFGTGVTSANIDRLRIERLRPDPRYGGSPIAFLSAHFHGTDMYWNNRFKDVQLNKLFDKIGVRYVFPEAQHIPAEGRALVRIWTDYTPVSRGTAPEGLHGQALKTEVARMVVSSYVAGNVDGPAHNGNNGGFAKFKDVSGREMWRGVLIDSGAAWNTPGEGQKPWRTNILQTGAVERVSLPVDLVEGLVRIAQATRAELAEWSRFPQIDEGARAIVEGQRARAREVLDHYGIEYARPEGRLLFFFPRYVTRRAAA